MTRLILALVLLAALTPAPALAIDCPVEPASPWAPQGYICPPTYGVGTASTWQGPGAARNDCTHALRDSTGCPPLRVTSLITGRAIIVVPSEWCMCWVGVTGPQGETERIIDLGPELVAALGLPGPGLYPVRVDPATSDVPMSDTAVTYAAPQGGPDLGNLAQSDRLAQRR